MEAVLPHVRAKTKRKRRKPMPPWLKFWLLLLILDLSNIFKFVVNAAIGKEVAGNMALTGFTVLIISWIVWPNFKREWDAWRKDDD